MKVVPSDSRYVPLTQQPYCCVPTCIQIVMAKRRIPLISQEEIGYYLGLTVPKKDSKYFYSARIGKMPKAGYGTQIYKKKYSLNRAFNRLGIRLKASYKLIDDFRTIDTFKKYLKSIEKLDVLACFDYGALYNTDYHHGHVCVVDKVYLNKHSVRLIDPEHNVPKWRTVTIRKLFESMKEHGTGKSAGFWELRTK
jgi:hypothetical protein